MFDPEDESPASATPSEPTAPAGRPGAPVDVRRLLGAVRAGRRWILGAAIVGAVVGVLVSRRFVPRQFGSSATIMWEPASSGAETGAASSDDGPRTLRTLVDSIKLPGNLAEVRRRMAHTETLESLGKRIEIEASSESHLVTVKTLADDPDEAARLASTVIDVFLEHRRTVERARLEDNVHTLDSDVAAARTALDHAHEAYDHFRNESGVADLPIERQAAIEGAARLHAEGESAEAEAAGEEARSHSLRTAAVGQHATTTLSESDTRPDAVHLAEVQAELASARARLSDDHPRVLALLAQANALRQRAADPSNDVQAARTVGLNPQWAAIQQTLTTSGAQREAAIRRRASYEALEAAARQRVDRLTAVEGRASELLASVHTDETHLATLEAAQARAHDSAHNVSTGFRVVGAPLRSERPAKSLRRVIAIATPVLFACMAVAFLLARALRGLRAYTPSEVAFWGSGPVVASTTWPRDPNALEDIALDLEALDRPDRIQVLIVGAGTEEAQAAVQLTTRLTVGAPWTGVVSSHDVRPSPDGNAYELWTGETSGAGFRRATRSATRVLVLVASGAHGASELSGLRQRMGREGGVGFVVLGLGTDLAGTSDRAGNVDGFYVQSSQSRLRSLSMSSSAARKGATR